jgi:uncharacterized protein with HEPN domain
MYDKTLVIEILSQIISALKTIDQRFNVVNSVDDFTHSPTGMEKLDSICMLLIAIGESLKKIDKITNKQLLLKYPTVDWKGAKGLRDIISHHYFDVDAKYIYDVCKNKLPNVLSVLSQIRSDLI